MKAIMEQTSVSIKAVNAKNTEIRRFQTNSFEELIETICRKFSLKEAGTGDTPVFYKDNEEDWVVLSNENEWNEAVRQMNGTRMLRIRIGTVESTVTTNSTMVHEWNEWRNPIPPKFRRGRGCGRGRGRGRRKGRGHRGRFRGRGGRRRFGNVEEKLVFLQDRKAEVERKMSNRVGFLERKLQKLQSKQEKELPIWKQKKLQAKMARVVGKLEHVREKKEVKQAQFQRRISLNKEKDARMKQKKMDAGEKKEFRKKMKLLKEMGFEAKKAKMLLRENSEDVSKVIPLLLEDFRIV